MRRELIDDGTCFVKCIDLVSFTGLFCLVGELQWAGEEVYAREGHRETQHQQGTQQ